MIVVISILVICGLFMLVKQYVLSFQNALSCRKAPLTEHFAVLIPARNESLVIEQLLTSLEKQTFPLHGEDIYVIVEDKEDETVKIVKEHHYQIVYRHDVTKKRKGYALDDAVKEILAAGKHYDAYFIFDADNVLDEHYFEEMVTTYRLGYDIGIGYRNCKNGNDSVYAAVSSLTFSMINTLGNGHKSRYHETLTISGTGFYVRGDILERLQGYPFHSLTEDYELTLFATLHDLTTFYNDKACFYDEQPITFKETITQRTRWIRGYFDCRKLYITKLKEKKKSTNYASTYTAIVGVKPFILLVLAIIIYIFWQMFLVVGHSFQSLTSPVNFFPLGWLLLFVYGLLLFITFVMLHKERHSLNLTLRMKGKALFFNPLFLISYVYCLWLAFAKKEVTWQPIHHQSQLEIVKQIEKK